MENVGLDFFSTVCEATREMQMKLLTKLHTDSLDSRSGNYLLIAFDSANHKETLSAI